MHHNTFFGHLIMMTCHYDDLSKWWCVKTMTYPYSKNDASPIRHFTMLTCHLIMLTCQFTSHKKTPPTYDDLSILRVPAHADSSFAHTPTYPNHNMSITHVDVSFHMMTCHFHMLTCHLIMLKCHSICWPVIPTCYPYFYFHLPTCHLPICWPVVSQCWLVPSYASVILHMMTCHLPMMTRHFHMLTCHPPPFVFPFVLLGCPRLVWLCRPIRSSRLVSGLHR